MPFNYIAALEMELKTENLHPKGYDYEPGAKFTYKKNEKEKEYEPAHEKVRISYFGDTISM